VSARYKALLPKAFSRFPKEALQGSIIDRFKTIVARHAAQPAVEDSNGILTYADLDTQSERLAAYLLQEFGTAKEPIALLYKHNATYNIAQFAVLKTGKFYANFDVDLPLDRQRLIAHNLEARVLLCDSACAANANTLAAQCPGMRVVNTQTLALAHLTLPLPSISIQPQDYAYLIYTSGSTGPAQGVIVSHENVLHFTRNHTNYMHLSNSDKATQLCPLWTGASAAEIFPVLLNGALLVPFSLTSGGFPPLLKLLQDSHITMFTAVPTVFRMLMALAKPEQKFPALRLLRLAGDRTTKIDVALFKQHCLDHCLLRVGLGASEALMFAHFFIDTQYHMEGEIAPVGYALEDLELLLLDDDGNAVPPGDYGEIAVRSRYLSVGYWKNPALTAERFLPDPHDSSTRIYLSRDIGYFDNQGRLHHVGRKDSRVKLYGKMVLISDVEEALLAIEGVKEAVVVPFDSGTRGTELAAFVTAFVPLEVAVIRQELMKKLPGDLVPRKILLLDKLPLQVNNKINRLKLKYFLSQEMEVGMR
jgi:amino acid adenylation domain-containing protein